MSKKRLAQNIFLVFLGVLILVDRIAWASVSQWHIDQSLNIWLGYTQNLLTIPVGLMSSYRIPNPNGMLIAGFFLSRLPNLWIVSTFLDCAQAGLIIWINWTNFKSSLKLFMVATIPLLVSVILRATSAEFWNQYFMTFVNLLFLLWAVNYLSRPALFKIPFWVGLICFAPAIYLAGIVNAITMLILGAGVIYYRPPANWERSVWKPVLLSLAVILISLWITWLPYFHAVSPYQLLDANQAAQRSGFQLALSVCISIILFPIYAAIQWAYVTYLNNSLELYNTPAKFFIPFTIWLGAAQGILALGAISIGLRVNGSRHNWFSSISANVNKDSARIVILAAGYILVSYTLSPLLGGPVWAESERFDQTIQFLPLFMLVCFLAPFIFRLPGAIENKIHKLAYTLTIAYAFANIAAGIFMVQSELDYRGSFLSWSNMDAPLIQKMQAADFIAADWKSISKETKIPVDYQLEGGAWSYITTLGEQYDPWYPGPMTLGRSFDFDLLRRFGLTNTQEGIQIRSFGTGRYLVTYAFEPAPELPGWPLRHIYFGRIRVSIVFPP